MKDTLIFDVFLTFSNPLNCCKLLKNKTRKSGHIHAVITSLCGAPPQEGQDAANRSPFDLAHGTSQTNSLLNERWSQLGVARRRKIKADFTVFPLTH
jgi:hypothetical protein